MKNIISSIGIFLATHSVLLTIVDCKKCFPTRLMGENPWYLMENNIPRLCREISTIFLENFDARVNISRPMAPLLFLSGELQLPFFFLKVTS
jgi:hypothetical protein